MSVDTWHAVVGLGTDGGQVLAGGDRLARGVHLRWSLPPELGFPVGGYHVSRRTHRDAEWPCLFPEDGLLPPPGGVTSWEAVGYEFEVDQGASRLDLDLCPPTGAVHFPGQRSLRIVAPREMVAVRAEGVGSPPLLELFAERGGVYGLVASARATRRAGDRWFVLAWAEGIVGCRLRGRDMRICQVCFGLPQETGGWRRLHEDPILLPVVAPGTENAAANLHGVDATRAQAYGRLSATLGREAREGLADAFAHGGLGELTEDLVRGGRGALVPAEATGATGARTPPRLGMPIAQLLALTALDPDVARMLGLYRHDPVESGTYDYKVVAHHGNVRFPSRIVAFNDLAVGPLDAATLALDGVTFVGTAGLEAIAPSRDAPAALRVAAPRIGTAAGLRFDPPVPAATVRLGDSTLVNFAAWRGNTQVASAVAFLGAATLEDADGLDAITWSTGPIDLLEVELYTGAGVVGDLTAYAWRLTPAAPAPVHALVLTDAAAAAEPARLHPDGTVDRATGVVGLDWGESSPLHDASRPVRVHAGRAPVAADGAPTPALEVRNADRPVPAFSAVEAPSRAGPDVPRRWIERNLQPASYAYGVRGIDAFGRLGEWSGTREVRVPAGTVPPPPDAVEAAYLDPADPYLSAEQRALAERDGPGLLVQWTWPAGHRLTAPGLEPNGEFRVYVHRGDPNLLEGTVRSVTDRGDRSRLATNCTLPGAAGELAGERVRVGGVSFEVVANAAGANAWIEVAHLAAPTARPATGAFTVHLSESSPLRTELAVSRWWDECVHVEPVGTPVRLTARITAVADNGGSAAVTLDRPLPSPKALPGLLIAGGLAFRVLSQSPGSTRLEVAAAVQADGGTALPAAGERCTVWNGAGYRAWLSGIGATPAAHERLALTLVGVSSCDVDAVILHEPLPPGPRAARPGTADPQPGLEGPVSRVARVSVPHRHAPPVVTVEVPPEQDGDIPADRAEPADWYGRARFDLVFTPVPGAAGYRVGRTSVAALFERDRGARQAAVAPYQDGPFDDGGASEAWLAEHHPSIGVDDLTADLETHPDAPAVLAAWRDWIGWFYPQKLNREVMALAELGCNEEALGPAHEGTIAGPPFADTFDGRGLGRFVYRVRSVDASGNASAWSAAFPLVDVRDVTPPAMPALLSLRAGENAVTGEWLAGREPDVSEYRIWRAETRDAVADVRRLEPLAVVPAATGTMTFTDENLPGLRTFYYRVAAVDASGNVSPATPAASARVVDTRPPNAPAWVSAAWVAQRTGRAVRLAWRADEEALTCVLQRRPLGGGVWRTVSPELAATAPPFDFRFLDRTAVEGEAYEYRVFATDPAGNPGVEFSIRQVRPR